MYNIFGSRDADEFMVELRDFDNESVTIARMSREVFAEVIRRNVDKIIGFDIEIDDAVEYVKVVDPCLMKPEVTD
jgi:hypothetical protein